MAFSYQHEYHAGNHADVLKHTCLALLLDALCKKAKPITVIDAHAGAGRFSLSDARALRTAEAEGGIRKLAAYAEAHPESVPPEAGRYLALEEPYLRAGLYAGSPELSRLFLRAGDRLHAIEGHPAAVADLRANMGLPLLTEDGELPCAGSVGVHRADSYERLVALSPPPVRRGLVLCDPSYEDASDYAAVTETLCTVHKKWHTAIIALWYPLLARRKNETAQMVAALEDFVKMQVYADGQAEACRLELALYDDDALPAHLQAEAGSHLYGSGMLIINPPWQFPERVEAALRFYERVFRPERPGTV